MIIKIKKRDLLIVSVFLILIILIPIIYAQANQPRRASFKVDLVISNRNPTINVSNVSGFAVDTVAAGNVRVLISFNVTDPDGVGQVNASKAVVNFTLGGLSSGLFFSNVSEVTSSEFGTCANHTETGGRVVINCTVILPYFSNASATWVVNISIQDTQGATGRNDTLRFTVNTVSGLALPHAFINFSNVNLNQQNVPAFPHLILNNTGNEDFDTLNITAATLVGTTTSSETIAPSQFFANITNGTAGAGVPLATTAVTLREVTQSAADTLDNATLVHGHTSAYSVIADKGNRSVFFWVDVPSGGLSSQFYNATWNATVINIP